MQNAFVSAYGWQWKHRRFGGIFQEEYRKAKERENYSADRWQSYQQQQLQKILLHAYEHVPYYKKTFQQNANKLYKLFFE